MMTNYFPKLMYRSSPCRTDQQNFEQYNFNKTIQQKTCISPKLKSHWNKSVCIVLHFLGGFFPLFFFKHIFGFFFLFFFWVFFFQIFFNNHWFGMYIFSVFNFFFFCLLFLSLSDQLLIMSFTFLLSFYIRTHYFWLYISFSSNLCY